MNKFYAMESELTINNRIPESILYVFNSKKKRDRFLKDHSFGAYINYFKLYRINYKEARRFLSYRLIGHLTFSGTIDDLIEKGVKEGICFYFKEKEK